MCYDKMKVQVAIVFFIFFTHIHCARVNSRQNDSKKEPVKMSKPFRSRGEVMESLFIIFDPSFLSYVWPKIKNGVHLNVGYNCWDDVSVFLKDLSEGRAWAYKAADASGRYHSGLFEGKRFWLGSKEQCLLLDESYLSHDVNETWGEFYSGDYLNTLFRRERDFGGNIDEWHSLMQKDELMRRVVLMDNAAPMSLAYTALQISLNITKFTMPKSFEITLGLCLPRSCTGEDVVSIINFSIMLNDNLRTNRTVSRSIKLTSLRHVEKSFNIKNDGAAVSLILITVMLIIVSIVATIVDLDVINLKSYSKSTSFDLEQYIDKSDKTNVKGIDHKQKNVDESLSFTEFKRITSKKSQPPVITLDVKPIEAKSCVRCGKYKKQCANPLQVDIPCPRVKYNSNSSLATDFKKQSIYKSLLLSFSLKHSWLRIFNTTMANKDLAMVHVLKIVAVLWIVFVHVAVTVSYLAENGGDINDYNSVYYIVSTGTLAFDTLFFVSGLFSAHHFFYLKSGQSAEELASKGGTFGQALQLICFIINRAIRLLPPYAFAMLLATVVSRVSRDTAALSLPERDYVTCASHWWRNLLYVTDLYPDTEQCMQISWYLSCETKLHSAGAALCMLLAARRRSLATALALVLVLAATAYDVFAAFTHLGYREANAFSLYWTMTARGWARVAPYLGGVLAAYLLRLMDGQCSLSKVRAGCLWAWSALALGVALALQWAGRSAAWAAAWAHLLWPLALLWPVLACSTKYSVHTRGVLSSAVVAGASRVCYCALLMAGIARTALLAADAALCARAVCLISYFAGVSLLTFSSALLLALLVEMPGCCLLRRLSDYTCR